MTTRNDVVPTYVTSPRVLEVQAPSTEMTMQDLVDTARKLEDSFQGMGNLKLLDASGKEDLGGGVTVGITVALQDARLAFEGRTTPAETGTVTSNPGTPIAGQDVFVDSAANFTINNVERGSLVINFTDQSIAEVVAVENSTTLRTKTLVNGIGNTYDVNDVYQVFNIIQCTATGGNLTAVDDLQQTAKQILPTAFTQVVITASASATNQNSESIEYASFDNRVWYDASSGISIGASDPTSALFGNAEFPLDNIPDILQVQQARGLPRDLKVLGPATFGADAILPQWRIVGENAVRSPVTVLPAADLSQVEIEEVSLTGTLDGLTIIRNSTLTDVNEINGFVFQCSLQPGTIAVGGTNAVVDFLQCFSGRPGLGSPIIDANGVTNTADVDISFREYSGGIEIRDLDSGANCSFDFVSGQLKVDLTTCTNGTIVARGNSKVIDAATGDFLWSGTYNGNLTIINETVLGTMVQEIHARLGLNKDLPVITNDDNSITIGAGQFEITISAVNTATSTTQTRQP